MEAQTIYAKDRNRCIAVLEPNDETGSNGPIARYTCCEVQLNVNCLPVRPHQITLLKLGTDHDLLMVSSQAGVKPDMGDI